MIWGWPADGRLIRRYNANSAGKKGINIAGRAGAPVRAEVFDLPENGDTVVGQVTTVKSREWDTLLDIARLEEGEMALGLLPLALEFARVFDCPTDQIFTLDDRDTRDLEVLAQGRCLFAVLRPMGEITPAVTAEPVDQHERNGSGDLLRGHGIEPPGLDVVVEFGFEAVEPAPHRRLLPVDVQCGDLGDLARITEPVCDQLHLPPVDELRRARDHTCTCHRRIIDGPSQAKVGDRDAFDAILQKNVGWLDVAMYQSLSVRGG